MTTSPSDAPNQRGAGHVHVVGTGLIGGSLALALRSRGWRVTGEDADPEVAARAVALGALDALGGAKEADAADIVVVATPVHAAAGVVRDLLARPTRRPEGIVTDVGGVKGPLVEAIDHPAFVGGHPMAGSEQVGIEGADGDLFVGATWVLTPTARTDPVGFARLRAVIGELGADVVELSPAGHDALVAVVSHVPHLTAAALMGLAAGEADEHAALLRLAAGGFRDMTRIAAGKPDIWPDICEDNAAAIVATMDRLVASLGRLRALVETGDRASLLDVLGHAAQARRALAERVPRAEALVEMRVPVRDRPGALADVTTLAAEVGVNIADLEIAHSAEGERGVLVLVVEREAAPRLAEALAERGYRAATVELGPSR